MLSLIVAYICLIWYITVLLVCALGFTQIYRHYRSPPPPAVCTTFEPRDIPHVTVIRPCKGIEPCLFACLAATFRQDYPKDKLTIFFCIVSRNDAAYPVLQKLLAEFPGFDVTILVEDEDPNLQPGRSTNLGPNPKIRNMSRAYREAKGDIVWIIDCNVWVGRGVCGRMVDTLCGFTSVHPGKKFKFVHQLPLVVDVTGSESPLASDEEHCNIHGHSEHTHMAASTGDSIPADAGQQYSYQYIVSTRGGRLEELFLSSSHAKFYTAINTVLIAPCIVGKSNMFRRSHLNALTTSIGSPQPPGIDFFSHNICEDHLIGDLLWKNRVPHTSDSPQDTPAPRGRRPAQQIHNHALLPSDPCIQPTCSLPITAYMARRARWLRVRKFTVLLATLVEPGTESLACSTAGAYALATVITTTTTTPARTQPLLLPLPQPQWWWSSWWAVFAAAWAVSVLAWAAADWALYTVLQGMGSIEADARTPAFARPWHGGACTGTGTGTGTGTAASKDRGDGRRRTRRRSFRAWAAAWAARELLAFPIWAWAVLGGVTVTWRGQRFRVGVDMRVRALGGAGAGAVWNGGLAKERRD